jgi:hypothetical protein
MFDNKHVHIYEYMFLSHLSLSRMRRDALVQWNFSAIIDEQWQISSRDVYHVCYVDGEEEPMASIDELMVNARSLNGDDSNDESL